MNHSLQHTIHSSQVFWFFFFFFRKSSSRPFGVTVPELSAFYVSSNNMNHSDLQDSPYEEAVTVSTSTQTKLPFNTIATFFSTAFWERRVRDTAPHALVLMAWEMMGTGHIWCQRVNEADTLNTVCQCPTLKQARRISLLFQAILLTRYHLGKIINSVLAVANSSK